MDIIVFKDRDNNGHKAIKGLSYSREFSISSYMVRLYNIDKDGNATSPVYPTVIKKIDILSIFELKPDEKLSDPSIQLLLEVL